MGQVFVAVIPYVVFSLLLLVAIFFFPAIATWFPNALVG
jgi:TRAP-type mannitol/chloroaromatic compound transport system permease large subunit